MGQCQFSYSPPVGWLGLWLGLRSEPYVVGRLGSGPRVGAGGGVLSRVGIFGRGLSPGELSPRIGRLNPFTFFVTRQKVTEHRKQT